MGAAGLEVDVPAGEHAEHRRGDRVRRLRRLVAAPVLAGALEVLPQGAGFGTQVAQVHNVVADQIGGAAIGERVEVASGLTALWGHSSSSREAAVRGYSSGSMPAYDRNALSASPYRAFIWARTSGGHLAWMRRRMVSRSALQVSSWNAKSTMCRTASVPPRRARPASWMRSTIMPATTSSCRDFCMEVN